MAATGDDAAAGPFLHGVASGDPLPDRVILWTRVTPTGGATPGSGVGPAVDVQWEIARDPGFDHVVGSGLVATDASRDHTVKIDATGLTPGADHWFRFRALDATSPVARTRTAPLATAGLDCLRLGIVTCAEYEFGFYAAYRHLAERDDLDAVLHLGDYIYEFGNGYGPLPSPGQQIGRVHEPPYDIVSLADYRTRYGQYKRDPDLQALHAAHPVIVIYDDHEVANDWWENGAENHDPATQGAWADRLAAGLQAWWEWTPARPATAGDPLTAYRRLRFGDLVDLWVLDERRHRSEHPENALISYGSVDPAIDDPDRTMLGTAQRDWLFDGLRTSEAAWKVLANPVPFFPFAVGPTLPSALGDILAPLAGTLPPIPPPLTVDDWNGYRAEQRALIAVMDDLEDVVVLTGDYHESFAADVPPRPGDYLLDGNSVGVEFIVPAVTSPGLSETLALAGLPAAETIDTLFEANLAASNPWVQYHEGFSNGFGIVEFSPERTHYDFWFLADRLDAGSGATVAASWQSVRGADRLTPASEALPDRDRPASPSDDRPVAPVPTASPGATDRQPIPTTPATGGGAAGAALVAGAAAAALHYTRDKDQRSEA